MYAFDSYDNSIVISGWENGIADSPYEGISNLQNINIASVPGEAAVGFATKAVSSSGTLVTIGTVTSVSTGTQFAFTGAAGLEQGMAISFGTNSNFTGIQSGTAAYWVRIVGANFSVAASPGNIANGTVVALGGSGTANFTIYTIATPRYFAQGAGLGATSLNQYMIDTIGQVWTNKVTTTSGFWTFTGNSIKNQGTTSTSNGIVGHATNDNSTGNGLVYFNSSNNTGYLFAFSASSVDYLIDNSAGNAWTYGWSPNGKVGAKGSSGNNGAQFNMGLGEITNTSHECLMAPDGNVYICDWWNILKMFQTDKVTPVAFDPTSASTYTFTTFGLLPIGDYAQTIAALGVNLLIGGSRNFVYQWDTTSNVITYPIFLPESNIAKVIGVDLNGYIFAGNRGRIYITNGSQAQLYKKIPDHISGTIEPYFVWGGVASNKNQLYFSFYVTDNSNNANSNYGGVWAVNLQTKAVRLTNQLSYGSYAGYASALLPQVGDPNGYGLFIGWNSNALTFPTNVSNTMGLINPNIQTGVGMDQGVGTPYTSSVAIIDSDNIPIGTFEKPRNNQRVEYLLVKPMVSGESITIQSRTNFSQTFVTLGGDSAVGNYTNAFNSNWQNAQWIQLRTILNSTASSPSYVRLKQLRITGLVGPTLANAEQLSA